MHVDGRGLRAKREEPSTLIAISARRRGRCACMCCCESYMRAEFEAEGLDDDSILEAMDEERMIEAGRWQAGYAGCY